MNKILKSATIILIFTIITKVFGFLYRIFLAKQIGAEGLGIYQIVLSVFFVLITLTSSGVPVTMSRKSAIFLKNNDYASHRNTVKAGIYFNFLLATTISLFIIIFQDALKWIFADARCMNILILMLPAFVFSAIYSACRGGLWGEKKFFAYSFVECMEELVLIISGIVLVGISSGSLSKTTFACVSVVISYCIASILSFLFFVRQKKSPFVTKRKNKLNLRRTFLLPKGFVLPLVKSSVPITAIRLTSTILSSLIAIIVPARLIFFGLDKSIALEHFGVFSGMTLPLLFTPSIVVGVLALIIVPEISTMKESSENLTNSLKTSITISVLSACVFIPLFCVLGEEIGLFLFENSLCGKLLAFSSPTMIFVCFSQISTTALNSLGYELVTMRNFLFGAGAMLCCIWFLTEFFGIYALLIGYFCNFAIQSVLNVFSLKRKVCLPLKSLLPALVIVATCGFSCIFCWFLSNICKKFMPDFLTIAVVGIVSVLVLFVLCFAFLPKKSFAK